MEPCTRPLDNGVNVYGFQDKNLALIRLEFIFEAGSFFQEKTMQAGACCTLLGAGTEKYNAEEISEKLDFYGAYLERYSDRDQATVVFYCLSRHFDKIIPYCEEVIKRSVFPQEELDTYLRKAHRRFLVNQQKVSELSRREFYSLVFGKDHPYGTMIEEEDFSSLCREDLVNFHRKYYVSDNCSIVIAGGYTEDHIRDLNRYFGQDDWKGEKVDLSVYRLLPGRDSDVMRIDIPKEGALQASLRMGMPLFSLKDPDFATFKMVDYVFGGYFGSRLMRNIREEKGYTYGISSYIVPLRFMPVWMIGSSVKADCCRKVIGEIEKEIEKLQDKSMDMDELELVRQSFMGDFMREVDGTFDLAEKMKLFLLADMGPEFYQRNEEVLFSITPEDIRQAACRFLNRTRFFTVTVGASDL